MPRRGVHSRIHEEASKAEEEGDVPACWICLGEERRDAQLGALRSPCACRGSVGYVHERCLQEWVQTRARVADTPGLPSCPTCKQRYTGDLLLLLAASSALQLQLDLPCSAESRLITELQSRKMNKEANALLRRRMRWNVLVADDLHPETLQGFCNVASALQELKQLDAAAVLLRRVLKCSEKLLACSGCFRDRSSLLLGRNRLRRKAASHLSPAAAEWEIEEEMQILESERRCVVAIVQDAADALTEVLRSQGRADDAEKQLLRKKAIIRKVWFITLAESQNVLLPLLTFMVGVVISCVLFAVGWGVARQLLLAAVLALFGRRCWTLYHQVDAVGAFD